MHASQYTLRQVHLLFVQFISWNVLASLASNELPTYVWNSKLQNLYNILSMLIRFYG